MVQFDPLILRRRPRDDMRHYGGTSWLGGHPALAGRAWPRAADGVPLTFIGQIDLGVVGTIRPNTPLPQSGALAFFADLRQAVAAPPDHAVLHLPLNRDFAPLPEDMPPLYGDDYARHFRFAPTRAAAPRGLPRWPLSLHPAPWDGESDEAATGGATRAEAMRLGARERRGLSMRDPLVAAALPQAEVLPGLGVHWNHSLHLYGNSLIQKLRAVPEICDALETEKDQEVKGPMTRASRGRWAQLFAKRASAGAETGDALLAERQSGRDAAAARLDEIERLLPAFHSLVSEVAEWSDRRAAWDEITPEDRRRLAMTADRLQNEFKAFGDMPYGRDALWRLGDDTLRHMVHGDEALWQKLPQALRDHINEHYMMPHIDDGWSQALGHGRDRHGAGAALARDHMLLLQVVADDFMCFEPGKGGALSFWIRPEAAEAGEWQATTCLIETE